MVEGEAILKVSNAADLSGTAFAEHCSRVEMRLWDFYGIRVVTRQMPHELKGDLDGLEIHIDSDLPADPRLFLLAHLFGHTVQWNTDPGSFELGMLPPVPVPETLLTEIVQYEEHAAGYGLSLLHECGIADVGQWFSDYSACDKAYLLHYYRTGQRGEFSSFWVDGSPAIVPEPIPAFTPQKRKFRLDGIVI